MASLKDLLNSQPASPETSSSIAARHAANFSDDAPVATSVGFVRHDRYGSTAFSAGGGGNGLLFVSILVLLCVVNGIFEDHKRLTLYTSIGFYFAGTDTETDEELFAHLKEKNHRSSSPLNRSITRSPPSNAAKSNRENSEAADDEPIVAPGHGHSGKKRGPSKLPKKSTKKPQKKKRKVENEQQELAGATVPAADQDESIRGSSPAGDDNEVVYCICRRPDSGKWMIGCDGCDDWFHGECVNIEEEQEELIDKYYCPRCQRADKGIPTWKRKCRLPSCKKPARLTLRPPSKYCSQEHGVEFFSKQLNRADLSAEQISALVASVSSATEFLCLGDNVPTLSNNDEVEQLEFPDEKYQLAMVQSERKELEEKKSALEIRAKYIDMVKERQKRVSEEIRNEEGTSAKGGKEICGFDSRLCYDDADLQEWYAGAEGGPDMEGGKLIGREGICVKKKCEKHKQWHRVAVEEIELEERLIREKSTALDINERKIRERIKIKSLGENR